MLLQKQKTKNITKRKGEIGGKEYSVFACVKKKKSVGHNVRKMREPGLGFVLFFMKIVEK